MTGGGINVSTGYAAYTILEHEPDYRTKIFISTSKSALQVYCPNIKPI